MLKSTMAVLHPLERISSRLFQEVQKNVCAEHHTARVKTSISDRNRFEVIYTYMCVCVPMPTHCTIMRFGFRTRRIDGVKRGLFSIHAPLG